MSGAQEQLRRLAELLDAPVATTYMGKGALPDDHPLAAGCGCDEAALQELLTGADVLLCVGTELGAETTGQYALRFEGELIQVDASPERIGATYAARPLIGDARLTLQALLDELEGARTRHRGCVARVSALRARIHAGLQAQGRATEIGLLQTIERVLPDDAITAWDMTILAYWAAPHLPLKSRPAISLPARIGHARLRLAGGDRREHRQPRPAGAGRGR